MSAILSPSMQSATKRGTLKYHNSRKKDFIEKLKAGTLPKRNRNALERGKPKTGQSVKKADLTQRGYKSAIRQPIKPRSDKRAEQYREYRQIRKLYLQDNYRCAVYPDLQAVEIHHRAGKIGKLLTDTENFLPVSRKGHIFIEANPAIAYEKGWSLKRLAR